MESAAPAAVYTRLELAAVEECLTSLERGTFNLKGWEGPGDEVSRLVLGLDNWLRNYAQADNASLEKATTVIVMTNTVVGIPAQPGARDLALKIARLTDGVVFDGFVILDGSGAVLASASDSP